MIDKLSFLKGGSESGSVSADEERLMQLFQNRAGLKKAYADLKDEFHILRDRLKQQEGATLRVQEQLDALGDLLADPATGFGALVFFQLRGLWKTCHQQLAKFATDLTRQQEARETARHAAECEATKNMRLADVDERLQGAASEADQQRRQLAASQDELLRLSAFWYYFKRRRLRKSLETVRQGVVAADAAVGDLHAEKSAINNEAAPEFPGISLNARRNIKGRLAGSRASQEIFVNWRLISFWSKPGRGARDTSSLHASLSLMPEVTTIAEPSRAEL